MRIYTLHEPIDPAGETVPEPIAVKEGFSWPAFVFSVIWALWHRLWFWALAFVIANVALGWSMTLLGGDQIVQGVASLALALIIGWTANDLRRRILAKRGFDERAVIVANNKETALVRYMMAQPSTAPSPPSNRAGGPW
jgi:hypothetical protein